jgi:hypothetical protein
VKVAVAETVDLEVTEAMYTVIKTLGHVNKAVLTEHMVIIVTVLVILIVNLMYVIELQVIVCLDVHRTILVRCVNIHVQKIAVMLYRDIKEHVTQLEENVLMVAARGNTGCFVT